MALINCPECNKEISDKATSCPNCGYPVEKKINKNLNSSVLDLCPKCGKFYSSKEHFCPDCGTKMIDCHLTEEDYSEMVIDSLRRKQWRQQMREKYVVGSPEFDAVLYNKRLQEEKAEADYYASIPRRPSEPEITCPYCKSTNTKKIGVISRSVSVGLFGLGSKKINRQWHCNNCGSDF